MDKTATEVMMELRERTRGRDDLRDLARRLNGPLGPFQAHVQMRASKALNEAADELDAAKRAFDSLVRAIEAEGFYVYHHLDDGTYSVRPREE